jgi:hypothetical protein
MSSVPGIEHLTKTGLAVHDSQAIWLMFNSGGPLDIGQFCIAMWLAAQASKGTKIPSKVQPWMSEEHTRIISMPNAQLELPAYPAGASAANNAASSSTLPRHTPIIKRKLPATPTEALIASNVASSSTLSKQHQSQETTRDAESTLSTSTLMQKTTIDTSLTEKPGDAETNKALSDYFLNQTRTYDDADCFRISQLLEEDDHLQWSHNPRIYIVLRKIGQIRYIDKLLKYGINDLCLPVDRTALPSVLATYMRDEFVEAQKTVLTKALDLENPMSSRHAHFTKAEQLPFEEAGKLGQGGYGYVDKVISRLSKREYPRKRFRRGRGAQQKEYLKAFKTELDVLKKIQHIHCVDLVASYTDTKYFGILMAPVADCNLAEYFEAAHDGQKAVLTTLFGCLANALSYLHENKIRHRDIKPGKYPHQGGERVSDRLWHSTGLGEPYSQHHYCG